MILDKMPHGVNFFDAVVIPCFTRHQKAILLKKRIDHPTYPNCWGFPAGKVKAGKESVLEAAQREIYEETGNIIPLGHLESTEIILPTRHRKLTGEDFYFWAYTFSLKPGRYIDEITVDTREHSCYKLERPENIFLNHSGTMIPDAQETFRMFCELKGIIKAT